MSVTPQDTAAQLPADFEGLFVQDFRSRFKPPSRLPLSVVVGSPPCDSLGSRCAGASLDVSAFTHRLFCSSVPIASTGPAKKPLPLIAEAIRRTVRQFGRRGCTGRMAQEFGDHPETAVERMNWVRQLVGQSPARLH